MPVRVRPNVSWVTGAKKTSGPYTGGPPKGLLHATICPSNTLPGYQNQSMAPHETLLWNATNKVLRPKTHYYFDNYAKALANKSGGPQTNRDTVLQWELGGYLAESTPKGQFDILTAPNVYWEQVADLIGPIVLSWKVANKFSRSYTGKRNVRMSGAEWDGFGGMCTHADAPENTHWDIPVPPAATLILQKKIWGTAPKPPSTQPPFPLPKGHYYGKNDGTSASHSGVRGTPDTTNIKKIQGKVKVTQDGKFGANTHSAVVAWQKVNGVTADGKVGPVTWNKMF